MTRPKKAEEEATGPWGLEDQAEHLAFCSKFSNVPEATLPLIPYKSVSPAGIQPRQTERARILAGPGGWTCGQPGSLTIPKRPGAHTGASGAHTQGLELGDTGRVCGVPVCGSLEQRD